jgi:hypothetical protein
MKAKKSNLICYEDQRDVRFYFWKENIYLKTNLSFFFFGLQSIRLSNKLNFSIINFPVSQEEFYPNFSDFTIQCPDFLPSTKMPAKFPFL